MSSSFSDVNEELSLEGPRKDFQLPHLPISVKVKNTFLDIGPIGHLLEEPAPRQRSTSAPPACHQRFAEGNCGRSPTPTHPVQQQMVGGIAIQGHDAKPPLASEDALDPVAARVRTEETCATGAAAQPVFFWVTQPMPWVPIAAAPQHLVPQHIQQPSARELQMKAHCTELAAASLRAQARLETSEVHSLQKKEAVIGAHDFAAAGDYTSVMLRNIPLDLTRDMFLKMVDAEGFAGKYDLVYLPIDHMTSANKGYAFINLISHSDAVHMKEKFEGFCRWANRSKKRAAAQWSSTQGLTAYVDRYRNSAVMHESVPDEAKPMLFDQGLRVAFPAPTRKLFAPQCK